MWLITPLTIPGRDTTWNYQHGDKVECITSTTHDDNLVSRPPHLVLTSRRRHQNNQQTAAQNHCHRYYTIPNKSQLQYVAPPRQNSDNHHTNTHMHSCPSRPPKMRTKMSCIPPIHPSHVHFFAKHLHFLPSVHCRCILPCTPLLMCRSKSLSSLQTFSAANTPA